MIYHFSCWQLGKEVNNISMVDISCTTGAQARLAFCERYCVWVAYFTLVHSTISTLCRTTRTWREDSWQCRSIDIKTCGKHVIVELPATFSIKFNEGFYILIFIEPTLSLWNKLTFFAFLEKKTLDFIEKLLE